MDLRLSESLVRVGLEQDGWQVVEPQHSRWLTADIWELTKGHHHLVVKRLARHREVGTTAFTRHWSQDCGSIDRWNYWLREPLAYQSGVVGCFAEEGVRAPACVGVDITDEDAVVAMEFVDGTPAENWDIDTYAEVARRLGSISKANSLSAERYQTLNGCLKGSCATTAPKKPVIWELLDDDRAWNQPLVAEHFPPALRSAANELHAQRHRLYSVLESLPRTLCHLDFWTKNLIETDDGSFVLLDWAFVGDGALGEDIGNLVPDAAHDFFVEPDQLPKLRKATLDAYVAGLGDVGWQGDPRIVELAMAASAVKYDWFTPLMLEQACVTEHHRYGGDAVTDSDEFFAKRGAALLENAQQGLHALQLANNTANSEHW